MLKIKAFLIGALLLFWTAAVFTLSAPANASAASFSSEAGLVLQLAASETDLDTERGKILRRSQPVQSKSGFINAPKAIEGGVFAVVIGVKDGDTFLVDAFPWPGVVIRTDVRLFGADTPEKRTGGVGGAQCADEVIAGKQATTFVKNILPPGTVIRLDTIFLGKYAGRTVAEVHFEDIDGDWKSLLGELIAVDLAVPYFGGTKRNIWC